MYTKGNPDDISISRSAIFTRKIMFWNDKNRDMNACGRTCGLSLDPLWTIQSCYMQPDLAKRYNPGVDPRRSARICRNWVWIGSVLLVSRLSF